MRFAEMYAGLIAMCLQDGVSEMNRRTGQMIMAMPGGASFQIDVSDGVLPTIGLRRTWPHVAAAEAAWCFRGHNHADWLRKWTKSWDQFCDPRDCPECDGTGQDNSTQTPGCYKCMGTGKIFWLEQAYGWRWRGKFAIDQLTIGLERLRRDSSDRRVWISSWDPGEDILDNGQKTVPCPVGFTLSILDGRLNSSLMIRSSDLAIGLPIDVMRHALVVAACAASLGVSPGILRFALAHPHIYEPHWAQCHDMINGPPVVVPSVMMPSTPVKRIVAEPDAYVAGFKSYCEGFQWPEKMKMEVVP